LPDVYHLYKGGSNFNGLALLSSAAVHVMHVNDYPANPSREAIKDSDRVYPGDGIAPLVETFRTLRGIGFDGYLSVELFNPGYWQQDPLKVARTALDKLKSVVGRAT
jgi:sugar phosphate isomerase/epimerase